MKSRDYYEEEAENLYYASDEFNIMSIRVKSTDISNSRSKSQDLHSPSYTPLKKISPSSKSPSPTKSPSKISSKLPTTPDRMAELVSETMEVHEKIRYQKERDFLKTARNTATSMITGNVAVNITENSIVHATDAATQMLISGAIGGIISVINLAIAKNKKRALFSIIPSLGVSFIPGVGPIFGAALSIAMGIAGRSIYDNFVADRITIIITLDQLVPRHADKRMATLQRNLVKVLQYIREELCPERCECEITEIIKDLEKDFTETSEAVIQEMIAGIMTEKIEEAKKGDAVNSIISKLMRFKEFLEKIDKLFANIHNKSSKLIDFGSNESKTIRKYKIIFKEFNNLIKQLVEVSGESVLHLKEELDKIK